MRIKLLEATDHKAHTVVLFSTQNGIGKALWQGTREAIVGQSFDVECDVDLDIDFASNTTTNEGHQFGVSNDGATTILSGRVEGHDDGGVWYLRLSGDCLIMFESRESDLAGQWIAVTIPYGLLRLTPIGG